MLANLITQGHHYTLNMDTTFSKDQVNFYTTEEKDENQRLDNLLIKLLKGVPKSHIYRIIRDGEVRVNKKRQDAKYKTQINDLIRIPPIKIKEASATEFDPNNKTKTVPKANFPIIFEDDYFLIINKPDGVACHGGSGISFGVIEQLRLMYPDSKFLELAHRLDRDTSGILILAKKRLALVGLQALMRTGNMKKCYLAMTLGSWVDKSKNVKAPLLAYLTKEGERRVRVDKIEGQYSQTNFTVISEHQNFNVNRHCEDVDHLWQSISKYTLVKAELKTGRTHQIRVHLQHLGHPIVGDKKYGDFDLNKKLTKSGLKRMFLHAYEIEFIHPITQTKIHLKSELPTNLLTFINYLAGNRL